MIDIPVDARVECADGPSGKSIAVIGDPKTHKVTHFAVEDETLAYKPYQRLVPVDQVAETTRDLIRLRCTRNELNKMEPFTHTRYIRKEGQNYTHYQGGEGAARDDMWGSPSTVGEVGVETVEEYVPAGALAVRPGTRVDATDGHIGHVAELLADEESGELSHLVLQEGHLWGKKEVMIPAVAIVHVEGDTVHLKLDKAAVEQLPSVPVRRRPDKDEAYPRTTELVAQVFDDPDKACETLEYVEKLHGRKVIKILNAAVLVKQEDGTASVTHTRHLGTQKSRVIGAIAGGIVGMVGGPAGMAVGALAGAGAGNLGAKWRDKGLSDEFLTGLQEHLQPGTSALIVLAEHEWVHPMSESLADWGGMVFQQTLTDELANELLKASETEE